MNYVACIAEGAAETAIIDILVDHHLLIFEREQMLDEQVLRCRNASTFESRYLRKGFSGKITVYRILDSRRERFRLSKAYEHKVDVINVVTAPEIEMLIILNENRYDDFKKSGMKPSAYCTIVSNFYFKRVAYICPRCHEVFKPNFKEAFWARHTPTLRKLTCTCCGYHGFCVETYGKEEKKNG